MNANLEMNAAIAESPLTTNLTEYWSRLRSLAPAAGTKSNSVPTKALAQLDRLTPVPAIARIRVLRNFSAEPLLPWLRWAGYQRGVRIQVELANFGMLHQELLDPASPLYSGSFDAVVLALWLDGVEGVHDSEQGLCCERGWELLQEIALLGAERLSSTVIVNTFVPPQGMVHSSKSLGEVQRINDQIRDLVAHQPNLVLVDVARLADRMGWDAASDERLWRLYKAPLTALMLPAWGGELGQALAAKCGRVRKVLVLDCDDTLWGGIVGEEGREGIRLDPTRHPDSVFYTFQRQVLELQRQGVLLALCSKNNEPDVFSVLNEHPHCLLRPKHLAAWRVNWRDKIHNLCSLAEELKLGLDQFVFIDNSPVECEHVRQALPQVDVLQPVNEAANLTRLLLDYNGFQSTNRTSADRDRTASYQAERQRAAIQTASASVDEFLQSLALEAEIGLATFNDLSRIHQLVERTNQFNLTTRRHSAAQLQRILESPDAVMLAMKARDRFGDYGLTGLAIARCDADVHAVVVDTFLMSCRVLGRRLEQALLCELIRTLDEHWPDYPIHAEYRRSAKNGQVADFLDRYGFRRSGQTDDAIQYQFVPERQPIAPGCVLIRAMKG